jgi:hypothetical protein
MPVSFSVDEEFVWTGINTAWRNGLDTISCVEELEP